MGDNSPSRCHARLQPWLILARLGRAKSEAEFTAGLAATVFPDNPELPAWRMLTWATSKGGYALARSVNALLAALIDGKGTAQIWDGQPQGFRLTRAHADEHGRLRLAVEEPRDALIAALQGIEPWRLQRCPICASPFYALRNDQKACSRRCGHVLRTQNWRAAEERRAAAAVRLYREGKGIGDIVRLLEIRDSSKLSAAQRVRDYLARRP